ncbi:MAG: hypothetical protein RLZZ157_1575, partial [Pseudomonadota bacterium]
MCGAPLPWRHNMRAELETLSREIAKSVTLLRARLGWDVALRRL